MLLRNIVNFQTILGFLEFDHSFKVVEPIFEFFYCGSTFLTNVKTIREFVADSVIQASGTVEFEDGLRTGVLLGGCWDP